MAENVAGNTRRRHLAERPPGICAIGCLPVSPMFSEQAWAQVAGSLGLSGRELEIVRGVFRGDAEPAIAAALGITSRTVHTHFERLYRKLGVTDRTRLILCVVHEVMTLTALPGTTLPPVCANFAAGRCPLRG